MMNITVTIDQTNVTLTTVQLGYAIKGALDAGAASAYSLMQRYPPPRGTYRRTGNLRRKLSIIKLRLDERSVVNTAPYARWVYGPQQAWMHVGRWASVSDASDAARSEAIAVFRKLLRRGTQ